jgi:hypothetical protein
MEVTKVKILNELTTIEGTAPNGRHTSGWDLTDCPDKPHKEFLAALELVRGDLLAKTPFGKKFGDGFTLTGISVSRNTAGRRQFSASAKIDFGWGETGVSIPLLLAYDMEKQGADNVLSETETAHVDELFAEGLRYYEGARHQTELALEDQEPEEAFEEAEEGELVGAGAAH